MSEINFFRRQILCRFGMCNTFRSASDDHGCWGECDLCGKRIGYVTRAALRRYADAEYAADEKRRRFVEGLDP